MPTAIGLPSKPEQVGFATTYNLLDYGSPSNVSAAITAALTDINAKGGGNLLIPRGTYTWNSQVDFTATSPISIIADKGAVMDGSGLSAGTYFLWLKGRSQDNPVSTANLTADAVKDTNSIVLDAAVTKGQIIYISCLAYCQSHFPPPAGDERYFFVPTRDYYTQGEFNIVENDADAGTTVRLRFPLRHSYVAVIGVDQVTQVHFLTLPSFIIQGIEFRRPEDNVNATYGFRIEGSLNPVIRNCVVSGPSGGSIFLRNCLGGCIENCVVNGTVYTGTTSSPAIIIESCEHVVVKENRCQGARAGVTLGGQHGPNRYIYIENNTLHPNYINNILTGIDFHANAEYCMVKNNTIFGGVIIQGRNHVVEGNTIQNPIGRACEISLENETIPYLRILNNTFIGKAGNNIEAMLFTTRQSDGRTYAIGLLEISGNTTISDYGNFFIFGANISSGSNTVNLDRLLITNNHSQTAGATVTSIANAFSTRNVTFVEIYSNRFISTSGRAFTFDNLSSVTNYIVRDNYFESNAANGFVFDCELGLNINVEGNYFKGASSPNFSAWNNFAVQNNCRIVGNLFENFGNRRGINASGTAGIVSDNRFIRCLGTPFLPAGLIEHWFGEDYTDFPSASDTVLNDPTTTARNTIQPLSASVVPLTLQAHPTQTASLMRAIDATGGTVFGIGTAGWVSIGTASAARPLHVYRASGGATDVIRAQTGDPGGFISIIDDTRTWQIGQTTLHNFNIRDVTAGNTNPIVIEGGAPSNQVYIRSTGRVGIAFNGPNAQLEVRNSSTTVTPLLVRGTASQTALLVVVQNGNGNEVFGINASGDLRTSRATAGSVLGNVVRKLLLINSTDGNNLGYIPIYDNIT